MRLKNTGFTLIELLVTLAVMGIILAIVVPNYMSPLKESNTIAYVNTLMSALRLARNEAITRGTTVEVCAVNAAGACVYSTVDWGASGWMVWVPATNEHIRSYPSVNSGYISFCCGSTHLQFNSVGVPSVSTCGCPTHSVASYISSYTPQYCGWCDSSGCHTYDCGLPPTPNYSTSTTTNALFIIQGPGCSNAYTVGVLSGGTPWYTVWLTCSGGTFNSAPGNKLY